MKSLLALAIGLSDMALASSLDRRAQLDVPAPDTQSYQLRSSSDDPSLDSQWVSLPVSSLDIRSYVLSSSQDAASRFYLVKYNATNTWELHAAEDGDRQVVLHGRNQSSELLYMSDVLHPGLTDVLEGELAEWGVFILDNNVLDVKDASALTDRSFVAVHPEVEDDYYEIALYDGQGAASLKTVTDIELNFVRLPRT